MRYVLCVMGYVLCVIDCSKLNFADYIFINGFVSKIHICKANYF